MGNSRHIAPAPGQESVWDYPRPPRCERTSRRIRVIFNGVEIADSLSAWRVIETSHPPVYYVPQADLRTEALVQAARSSFCEWKGIARYFDVTARGRTAPCAAWTYPEPIESFAAIADHVAFYAHLMDGCFVDEERVRPQPGGYYGGWITEDLIGPFKGAPGSDDW